MIQVWELEYNMHEMLNPPRRLSVDALNTQHRMKLNETNIAGMINNDHEVGMIE